MALTKQKKAKQVEQGVKDLSGSETVVVVDFSGIKTPDLNALRRKMKSIGGVLRVMKKRMLGLVFEKEGIAFEREKFEGQAGVVFGGADSQVLFSEIYKFSKDNENLKVLGGFDVSAKKFIGADEIIAIGSLPGRDVLIAQVVGSIAAPIRSFLYVLKERSEAVANK